MHSDFPEAFFFFQGFIHKSCFRCRWQDRCCVAGCKYTKQASWAVVHRGASHWSCGYCSMLGRFPGCEFSRPRRDSNLPPCSFSWKICWGGENNNNHKQSLSIEQTACTCTVAASSSLCLHGNIHFDMQIPPPFVQCSTEGNIDFSERQRAFALIVKLQLYPSFFLFFFWLLLQLNFSMSYLSFFPRCGAKTVCWSRGFHSEEER